MNTDSMDAAKAPVLVYSRTTLANCLGVTTRQLSNIDGLPEPFYFGKLPRWRVDRIREWLMECEASSQTASA